MRQCWMIGCVSGMLLAAAGAAESGGPLRLPNGEPLVCIYYFPHWWDPWRSDDDAVRRDFRRLREMGFNTLLLDHEWSQRAANDWGLLDRSYRLAGEAGLAIVPWLGLKTTIDIAHGERAERFGAMYGVDVVFGENQDGSTAAPLVYDEGMIRGHASYALDYMRRYREKSLLRVTWDGEVRPVICLTVETGWPGSFDEGTNGMFREWLTERYGGVEVLNRAWGTQYEAFADVDPRDSATFDYKAHRERLAARPESVEDHVAFRAQTLSQSLAKMGEIVRREHPDALLLAEAPYQFWTTHPHAHNYRVLYGANPEACGYADVVLFRATGPLTDAEIQSMREREQSTGQRFVLTYRTYSDWDIAPDAARFGAHVKTYAAQAASVGAGFGFYSWNEMVDTHVAYAPGARDAQTWTIERSERAIGVLGAMVARYREMVGTQ